MVALPWGTGTRLIGPRLRIQTLDLRLGNVVLEPEAAQYVKTLLLLAQPRNDLLLSPTKFSWSTFSMLRGYQFQTSLVYIPHGEVGLNFRDPVVQDFIV